MFQSVGIILGIILFSTKLSHIEVWKLMLASLFFNAIQSYLQYANIMRFNITWGISDFQINTILMLLGKATTTSFSVLPMTIMMMEVVPKNIEASMFAFIGAIIAVSTDCLGEVVGSLVLDVFQITTKDMHNFGDAIKFKILMIFLSMLLVNIIPLKSEIEELNRRMNQTSSDKKFDKDIEVDDEISAVEEDKMQEALRNRRKALPTSN
jgi:hypothetical protein